MPIRGFEIFVAGLEPDPDINLLDWANAKFILPRESTAEYGRYRSARTPMVEPILQDLSPQSPTQIVVLVKPAQLGGTTIVSIFLLGMVDISPGPSLCILPTDTKARSFSKKRLAPVIRLVPELRNRIKESRVRDSGNTILEKTYPGGSILLAGAGSGASFRQESIKYLALDDFDDFDPDIEGEGSPEELADRRTGSFPGRKIFINSTPTQKGASNIEQSWHASSQGHFSAPCPICGHYQYLIWGDRDSEYGIRFERDENGIVIDVWYQCECCKGRIDESEKPWMTENADYIHEHSERPVRGYRYNALLTPVGWINSWKYIAQKYVEAVDVYRRGNPEKLKTWLNTLMSEWYEPLSARTESELDALKDDRPSELVPSEGVAGLIGGIDTQDNGFWYVIRAFGNDLESWLIRYGFIDSFEALERIFFESSYKDINGNEYPVLFSFQDAMGHRTSEVYEFVRGRAGILPSQGVEKMGPKVRITKIDHYPGTNKPMPSTIKLARINTQYYKDFLSTKIKKIAPADPGAFHLHADIGREYISQMTAEFIDDKGRWQCPPNRANHIWDCETLCLAAADYIGVKNFNKPKSSAPKRPRTNGAGRQAGGRKMNPWKK